MHAMFDYVAIKVKVSRTPIEDYYKRGWFIKVCLGDIGRGKLPAGPTGRAERSRPAYR